MELLVWSVALKQLLTLLTVLLPAVCFADWNYAVITNSGSVNFARSIAGVGTNYFVVGDNYKAVGTNTQVGVAYLYNSSGALLTTITNPNPMGHAMFGTAVAAVGTNLFMVTAQGTDMATNLVNTGQAYLYNLSGILLSTFNAPHPMTNSNPAFNGDSFGSSVAAVGSTRLVIGSQGKQVSGVNVIGEANLFYVSGALISTITNSAPTNRWDAEFGLASAGVGDGWFLVGAEGQTVGTNLFKWNQFGSWHTNQYLGFYPAGRACLYDSAGNLLSVIDRPNKGTDQSQGSTGTYDSLFSHSMTAVGTSRFAISAISIVNNVNNVGQVYVYSTNGTKFVTITNPAPSANDWFGASVAALGTDQILIGAPNKNSVYIYDTTGAPLYTLWPGQGSNFGNPVAAVGTNQFVVGADNAVYLYTQTQNQPTYLTGKHAAIRP